MSTLFDKARKMLEKNREQRRWQRHMGAAALLVGAVICALLIGTATALSGAGTLSKALTKNSGLFWRESGTGESAWQQVDSETPLAEDSELRLRLAFTMDAADLKDGASYSYALPEGLAVEDAESVEVYDGTGAENGSETGAVAASGLTASLKDNILTVAYAGEENETAEGTVSFYVDVDFTFADLVTDDEGAAKLKLNDEITLSVVKAQETAAAEETTSTSSESASAAAAESAVVAATTAENTSTDSTSTESDNEVSAAKAATVEENSGEVATTESTDAGASATAATEAVSNDASSAAAASTVDGSTYLTSAKLSKNVNGTWQETTEFTEGDNARVDLAFTFPTGTITPTAKTVTYQLPDGVSPTKEIAGQAVYQNGVQVGTFDVSTAGLVTITFNDDYATGNTIVASLYFEGTVERTGDSADGTIQFSDTDQTTISVNPKATTNDVHIAKAATLNSGHDGATYTVTVTTNNGTDGSRIEINDAVTSDSNVSYTDFYNKSTLQVVKKTPASDAGTVIDPSTYTVTWDTQNGKPHYSIKYLSNLAAGESYVITYTASFAQQSPDADASIVNRASANTPALGTSATATVSWKTDDVKTGKYSSGWLYWDVTLNRNNKSMASFTMTDTLPGALVGAITVTDSSGKTILTLNKGNNYTATSDSGVAGIYDDSSRQLSLKWPETSSDTGTYTVSYRTCISAGTGDETVTNTANTVYRDGTKHAASASVTFTHNGAWGVSKVNRSHTFAGNGTYTFSWRVTATAPEGASGSYTISDILGNLTGQDGYDYGSAGHYVVALDLFQTLSLQGISVTGKTTTFNLISYGTADDGSINLYDFTTGKLAATAKVAMYDATGNLVSNDSSGHVKSFAVTITPVDTTLSYANSSTTMIYESTVDTNSNTIPDGAVVTAGNTARVGLISSYDEAQVGKTQKFSKQVLIGSSWTSADKTVEYVKTSDSSTNDPNRLTYRLMVDTTNASGDIVITDTLPEGMSYVAGSAQLVQTINGVDEYKTSSITPSVSGQKLAFTIKSRRYETPGLYYISYKASWSGDSYWDDPTHFQKTYTNTATWGDSTVDDTVTIHREPTYVVKKGAQVYGDDGKPTNRVKYTVTINPAASDLVPSSEQLTLTDKLSGYGTASPTLDAATVKLYAYSATATDHIGTELSKALYTVSYDAQRQTMTVKLPDSMACVLVYEYTLDGFSGLASDLKISNTATLEGVWSSQTGTAIEHSTSGAVSTQGQFTLYKVDADDYKTTLTGAKFDLYSGKSGSFAVARPDVNVDNSISWDLLSPTKAPFEHDVLYKFVETQAPDGYALSSTPVYVVWLNDGETADQAWAAILSSIKTNADGTQIAQSDVYFIPYTGGSIYVPNTYSRLTVQKIWTAPDGTELPSEQIGVKSITVKLYRDVKNSDGTITQTQDLADTVSIIPDAKGAWINTWDNLKKTGDDGTVYVYRVEEEGLEHSYRASYLNNDVKTGTITINNTQAYQLPKTGGIGDLPFVAGGAALAAAAVVAFIALRRRTS